MHLSIIIPVFKVEDYLRKCLDSILEQDYDDYELILVDDGSPDGCPQICDEYSKKYDNVKVIHQKNGGVCAARNAGLAIASGVWIWFIDGDDYIDDGAIRHISDISYKYDVGLIVFEKELDLNYNLTDINLFFEQHYFKYHLGFGPWNKWYKRTIIEENKLSFDTEEKIGEDLLFNVIYYKNIRHIIFTNYHCYHYVQHSTSAMHQHHAERLEQQMRLYRKIIKQYHSIMNEKNQCIMYIMHMISGLNQSGKALDKRKKKEILKNSFIQYHFPAHIWTVATKEFFQNERASFLGRVRCRLMLILYRLAYQG